MDYTTEFVQYLEITQSIIANDLTERYKFILYESKTIFEIFLFVLTFPYFIFIKYLDNVMSNTFHEDMKEIKKTVIKHNPQ